jgi:hypothetical protein
MSPTSTPLLTPSKSSPKEVRLPPSRPFLPSPLYPSAKLLPSRLLRLLPQLCSHRQRLCPRHRLRYQRRSARKLDRFWLGNGRGFCVIGCCHQHEQAFRWREDCQRSYRGVDRWWIGGCCWDVRTRRGGLLDYSDGLAVVITLMI